MIGLDPFRPDLPDHEAIVGVIEPAVEKYTVAELEKMNAENRQAGVPALKHEDFIKTPHVGSTALHCGMESTFADRQNRARQT